MLSVDQEAICRAIDQRARDQMVVAQAMRALEPPQLYWTGNIYISAPTLRAVSVR